MLSPDFSGHIKVQLLIGKDNKRLITPSNVLVGGFDKPVAEQISLGWVFSGPLEKEGGRWQVGMVGQATAR